MIEGYAPLIQSLMATFFTWGVTALGSAMVFFCNGYKRSFLDASLGFSAGVMTAATFWSLLLPALEMTAHSNEEDNKFLSLIPILIGFFFGAGFVCLTDMILPDNYIENEIKLSDNRNSYNHVKYENAEYSDDKSIRQRTSKQQQSNREIINETEKLKIDKRSQFRKIVLLIIAVTVHNIPEGLAVGVGFGAVGKTKKATFHNARNLAIGIGIQNFPEGLAVSLPLYASGFSSWKSFWYGQLSGMVEPFAGILGTLAVGFAKSCLPYALSFAAGAMLWVVFENLMPEASSHGNSKLSTWCCMIGFCVMMSLDVGLS